MMRPSVVLAAALTLSAASTQAGCATLQSADRKSSDLSTYFAEHPFPRSCDTLWADALRVAASRGFPLSSKDRQFLSETPEGVMGQLVSAATQTYRLPDGGLLTETDWRRESGTRLRLTARPAPPDACRVRYDVIAGGVTTADEQELGPDWNFNLDLLQRVDPAKAATLAASLP
jgi:hypothetical protein